MTFVVIFGPPAVGKMAVGTQRDIAHSRQLLLEGEQRHRLNTRGDFFYPDNHLRIDNANVPAAEAARMIAERFSLPLAGTTDA